MTEAMPPDPRLIGKVKISKARKKARFDESNNSAGNSERHKKAGGSESHSKAGARDRTRRGPRRKSTQVDFLIELAEEVRLFRTPDHHAFADVHVEGHRQTWRVRGKDFRRWLTGRYFEEAGGAPSSDGLQRALDAIEAQAFFGGQVRTVSMRVASLGECLYVDLCDPEWRVIEIDSSGWRITPDPPVRFRRSPGMRELPVPTRGGSIEKLRSFLNVKSERDFVLLIAWLLACLRDRGPYPVLVLSGEQGSAKSTAATMLKSLVDPHAAALRTLPREERDLFIAATHSHVLAFDNVSGLSEFVSDTLCRLSTGGAHGGRQLYTDDDEIVLEASRPVILNGIEEIVTRPDLADRAIFLTLEPISDENRRTEGTLWPAFNAERAGIIGALLDAVAGGLLRLPDTQIQKLPRMADFALWASACETTFWRVNTFMNAYSENRDEVVEAVIEADPVATNIVAFMQTHKDWTGTATALLAALTALAGDMAAKSKTWPRSPRGLGNRLRRAATNLRRISIEITHSRGPAPKRERTIQIINRA